MVFRVYVEKKPGLANEAAALKSDAKTLLGIKGLEDVRILNRYDAENIDAELFDDCIYKVFAEPQLDNTSESQYKLLGAGEAACIFAVEALPGVLDRRAATAEQCIQILYQRTGRTVRFVRF